MPEPGAPPRLARVLPDAEREASVVRIARSGRTRAVALVAGWSWLVVAGAASLHAQAEGVFLAVERPPGRSNSALWEDISTDAGPRTLRSRLVRIDFGQLDAARAVAGQSAEDLTPLTLNLFDDTVLAAHVESTAPTASGYALSGRLIGEPFGTMTLVVNGTVVAGTVRTLEATWRIRTAGAGMYRIRQVDLSTLAPGGKPRVERAPASDEPAGDGAAVALEGEAPARAANGDGPPVDMVDVTTVDGPAVDMIVFYTPEAREHEGGKAEIEATIDLFVTETNQAYADSGVLLRLDLVRAEEVDYFEEGGLVDDYGRFGDRSDGHMDDVFELQAAYAADMMHLVTLRDAEDSGDLCGLATAIVGPGAVQETASATSVDCGAMTFAHEVGHNMGLAHDRYTEQGDVDVPYPYSAGYVNQRAFDDGAPESSRWRTVMAYPDQCARAGFHCTQLFRFSNPDQTYAGDPLGVPGDEPSDAVDGPADARRSLNNLRWQLANFRNSRDRILCKPVLSPARQSVPVGGGTFEVSVTVRHDCDWTATSDAEFVSVTQGASGAGPAVVAYEVEANDEAERSARLIISGHPFLIDQPGPGSGGACDRTAQVMEAIMDAARVTRCWEVTSDHLAAIDSLVLNDKRIAMLLPGDFAGMSGLVDLNLTNNDLTDLPGGIFAGLSTLRYLSLHENDLAALPGDAFADLSSLESLGLGSNDLTTLPDGIFTGLTSVRQLHLHGNRLNALPDGALAGLSNLVSLWMGGNELTHLAQGIFAGLSNLETLLIQSNKLTTLPEDVFAGLTALERIWLGANELTELPEDIFDGLSNLDNLALGPNPLRSLPERIFEDLPKLGFLDLANTELAALPREIFAGSPALRGLWLFGNELTELPAGIFSGLSGLRNLELNDNPGAPFTLTLELVVREQTSTGGTVAVEVAEAAPFDMTLGLSATGGTLSAGTATVGAGETASPKVTVNREASTVTVRPGDAPPIPQGSGCGRSRCFTGLQLAVGGPVELSN